MGSTNDGRAYRAATGRVSFELVNNHVTEIPSLRNHVFYAVSDDDSYNSELDSDDDSHIVPTHKVQHDVTTHVLEFLPKPKLAGKRMTQADKAKSKKNLMKQEEHLGVQTIHQKRVSEMSMASHAVMNMDPEFESMIAPEDMKLLALVSHNNMKGAMRQFVLANMEVLKKFRLTGTNTTMKMLKEVFGDDPDIVYGPVCKSGPLGGDAQLVAMAVTGLLGACVFFIDPMDAHPHSADIECLVRQGNVHNVLMMLNPSTAHVCMNTLRVALQMGRMEMIPSFFFDLESPSVAAYKRRQDAVLQRAINQATAILPTRETEVAKCITKALNTKESLRAISSEAKIEKVMEIEGENQIVSVLRANFSLILAIGVTIVAKVYK